MSHLQRASPCPLQENVWQRLVHIKSHIGAT